MAPKTLIALSFLLCQQAFGQDFEIFGVTVGKTKIKEAEKIVQKAIPVFYTNQNIGATNFMMALNQGYPNKSPAGFWAKSRSYDWEYQKKNKTSKMYEEIGVGAGYDGLVYSITRHVDYYHKLNDVIHPHAMLLSDLLDSFTKKYGSPTIDLRSEGIADGAGGWTLAWVFEKDGTRSSDDWSSLSGKCPVMDSPNQAVVNSGYYKCDKIMMKLGYWKTDDVTISSQQKNPVLVMKYTVTAFHGPKMWETYKFLADIEGNKQNKAMEERKKHNVKPDL